MNGFWGADVASVRGHAGACDRAAGRIESLVATCDDSVVATRWEGPDAESFRERWHSGIRPEIARMIEELRIARRELEEHAEDQDRVSGGDGGTAAADGQGSGGGAVQAMSASAGTQDLPLRAEYTPDPPVTTLPDIAHPIAPVWPILPPLPPRWPRWFRPTPWWPRPPVIVCPVPRLPIFYPPPPVPWPGPIRAM